MIAVADLKDWLGIAAENTEYDDVLEQLEARCVAYSQQQTGRYFGEVEETTVYIDGTGTSVVWLPDAPRDPLGVSVSLLSGDILGNTTLSAVNFRATGRRLVRISGGRWPIGTANIAATYERGYEPGEEPADIRQAVFELVESAFRNRVTVTPADAFSENLPTIETRTVRATFNAWRSAGVG